MLDRCLKSGALDPTENTQSPAMYSVFCYQGSTYYAVVTEPTVMNVALFNLDNLNVSSASVDRAIFLS